MSSKSITNLKVGDVTIKVSNKKYNSMEIKDKLTEIIYPEYFRNKLENMLKLQEEFPDVYPPIELEVKFLSTLYEKLYNIVKKGQLVLM